MKERYIGVMSGTSVDAIDAVLCHINERGDVSFEDAFSLPIAPSLAKRLHAAMTPERHSLPDYKQLEYDYSKAVVETINALLQQRQLSPGDIAAVGCHGQTLWHQPPSHEHPAPFSLQLINAPYIAFHCGIDVISDFRQNDIIAGGEGAPLVPAFHFAALTPHTGSNCAVLNLGGIANITWLGESEADVIGFDTGPANTLLDAFYRHRVNDSGFDVDGKLAASGRCITPLLSKLLADPYFSRTPPKSTGREIFNLKWLNRYLQGDESVADVLRTLVELSAYSVMAALRFLPQPPERLIACGGGVYNPTLMQALQQQLGAVKLQSIADFQLDPQAIEGMAFAWLAWCYEHKKPGNLPAVTGAQRPVILGTKTYAS